LAIVFGVLLLFLAVLAQGRELRVAVAANFLPTFRDVAAVYRKSTGHAVSAIGASSGKLYAQILNGAPFDLFLAADSEYPRRLEEEGAALAGSRATYALGQLVLWSPRTNLVDPRGEVLKHGGFRHLALANPATAPYGRAARQVLERLGLWEPLQGRVARGESVGQAFQFVVSGNAELGFVAAAQAIQREGSRWVVPTHLYDPLTQQAVVLAGAAEQPRAQEFLEFLVRDPGARRLIREHGYELP
jgi:molybdate transport system substrate-binding protein